MTNFKIKQSYLKKDLILSHIFNVVLVIYFIKNHQNFHNSGWHTDIYSNTCSFLYILLIFS